MDQLRPTRETTEVINAAFASLQRIGREAVDRAAANLTLGPEGKHTAATRHVETCARQIHAILQPRHSTLEPERPTPSIPLRGKKGPVPPTPAPAEDDEDESQDASDSDTEDADDDKAPTIPLEEVDPGDEDFDEGGDAAPIAESLQQEQEDEDDEEAPSLQRTREVHLKPFNPQNDTDYQIAALRVSITRHGVENREDMLEMGNAIEKMIERFRMAEKRLPSTKPTIRRVIKFIEAAVFIMKSGSSFFDVIDEVDFEMIDRACKTMRLGGQKQDRLEDMVRPYLEAREEEETPALLHETFSMAGRLEWHDVDSVTSAPNDDLGIAKRGQLAHVNRVLFYAAAELVSKYTIFNGIEEIIADHDNPEERDQLREWYTVAARQTSLQLNPRTKRKGDEVLHSPPADIENLLRIIEEGRLPKSLWRQQSEVIEAVGRALQMGYKDLFFEMPPGTGKSLILAILTVLLGRNGNVLYLAPSMAICEQDEAAYRKVAGHDDTGLVGGKTAVLDQQATFSTYTSFVKYTQLNMFPPDKFNVIVLDEGHRSLSEKRMEIRRRFPNAIIIAATASGTDISGKSLEDELTPVYKIDFLDGIRAGMINPIRLKRIGMPAYTTRDMERAILEECRREGVGTNGEQAIVMMAKLASIRRINYHLSASGLESRMIEGTMPPNMARGITKRFMAEETDVLNICRTLFEGWDYPKLKRLFIGCDEFRKDWELRQRVGRIVRVVRGKGDSTVFELVDQARLDLAAKAAAKGEHLEISGLDKLFALDQNPNFQNGDRIAEPIPGFWPEHARLI